MAAPLPPSHTHTPTHAAVCTVLTLADLGRKDVLFQDYRSNSPFETHCRDIRDGGVIFEIHVISVLPRSGQRLCQTLSVTVVTVSGPPLLLLLCLWRCSSCVRLCSGIVFLYVDQVFVFTAVCTSTQVCSGFKGELFLGEVACHSRCLIPPN